MDLGKLSVKHKSGLDYLLELRNNSNSALYEYIEACKWDFNLYETDNNALYMRNLFQKTDDFFIGELLEFINGLESDGEHPNDIKELLFSNGLPWVGF